MMRSIKAGWCCFHAPVPTQRVGIMSRHMVNIAARMTTFDKPLQGIDPGIDYLNMLINLLLSIIRIRSRTRKLCA
jgi:hypothetical protein